MNQKDFFNVDWTKIPEPKLSLKEKRKQKKEKTKKS